MNHKILPLIVILTAISMAVPSYSMAYAQSSQSLGIVISSTMNGVQTALHQVKSGTVAYQQLNQSLTYLTIAQKLYNAGNYTGAEYYLKIAMNESYSGVISAGGEAFTVPPGLNVSRVGQNVAVAFNATLAQQVKGMPFENTSQIERDMEDYHNDYTKAAFIMPAGTIGVYDNLVYINLSYPLPVIKLGNQSYTVGAWVLSNSTRPVVNTSVLGIINYTGAYRYVMANAGSQITVFPPSNDNEARVHVNLYDIGTLKQQPKSNLTVYYTPVPAHKLGELTDDQEFNMSNFFSITNRTVVMLHHDHEFEFENSSVQVNFNEHGVMKIKNGTEVNFNSGIMSNFKNETQFGNNGGNRTDDQEFNMSNFFANGTPFRDN